MLARMWRKGNPHTLWWGWKLVQPLWKTVWRFLKKLKIELPYDPAIPLLGIDPKELKAEIRTDTYNVHSSIIHNSQKVEATPSVHKQINKQNVGYTYNGILFSPKKG